MTIWQIFALTGLGFLILELFMPMAFFLNFAIGAFLTAIFAVFIISYNALIPIFVILSILSLIFFRPFLANNLKVEKSQETGIAGKYIGQIVKVIEEVSEFSGVITIYGERWEARSFHKGQVFPVGTEVKIVKNESLIMFVENINL